MAIHERHDDGNAFIPERGRALDSSDDLAALLAEEFLQAATGADDGDDDVRQGVRDTETGGPFVETSADTEFGTTVDDPPVGPEVEREALPVAVARLAVNPRRK